MDESIGAFGIARATCSTHAHPRLPDSIPRRELIADHVRFSVVEQPRQPASFADLNENGIDRSG